MARPAEKARAMLNKWVRMREQGNAPEALLTSARRKKRPHLASECDHLADAEYYRNQIVREIAGGISKIQNPGLGEHAIRELNDEINRKMREKYHWNKRIYQLGGVDMNAMEKKRQMEEGGTSYDQSGYRYFGAAKDLPGVREILSKREQAKFKKQSNTFQHNQITPDYYGWRDEEDGVLVELESQCVQQLLQDEPPPPKKAKYDENVPSMEQVSQILLEYKKQEMLAKLF